LLALRCEQVVDAGQGAGRRGGTGAVGVRLRGCRAGPGGDVAGGERAGARGMNGVARQVSDGLPGLHTASVSGLACTICCQAAAGSSAPGGAARGSGCAACGVGSARTVFLVLRVTGG
jgi:hypothetical protein